MKKIRDGSVLVLVFIVPLKRAFSCLIRKKYITLEGEKKFREIVGTSTILTCEIET